MTKAIQKKSDPKSKQNIDLDQTAGKAGESGQQIPIDESIEQVGQAEPDNILQQMLSGDETTSDRDEPDTAGAIGFNDAPSGHGERKTDTTRGLDTE
jgi:hypothetical protein